VAALFSDLPPSDSGVLNLEVDVKNTGNTSGKEVVQVFIGDIYASITPSVKRLRAFKKIKLEAGESKTLRFDIPIKDLAFVGIDNKWIIESGEFKIQINDLEKNFEVQ